MVPTFLGATLLVFIILQMAPGGPLEKNPDLQLDQYPHLSFHEAKEKRIGEATEQLRKHKQCYLDLKRIRENLADKMQRWNV